MNATTLPILPASAGVLLLAKVTILMALAGLVTALLRGRSAAARHVVWLAALAGAVALLPLSRLAPPVPFPVPAQASRAVPRLVLVPPPATARAHDPASSAASRAPGAPAGDTRGAPAAARTAPAAGPP